MCFPQTPCEDSGHRCEDSGHRCEDSGHRREDSGRKWRAKIQDIGAASQPLADESSRERIETALRRSLHQLAAGDSIKISWNTVGNRKDILSTEECLATAVHKKDQVAFGAPRTPLGILMTIQSRRYADETSAIHHALQNLDE